MQPRKLNVKIAMKMRTHNRRLTFGLDRFSASLSRASGLGKLTRYTQVYLTSAADKKKTRPPMFIVFPRFIR